MDRTRARSGASPIALVLVLVLDAKNELGDETVSQPEVDFRRPFGSLGIKGVQELQNLGTVCRLDSNVLVSATTAGRRLLKRSCKLLIAYASAIESTR